MMNRFSVAVLFVNAVTILNATQLSQDNTTERIKRHTENIPTTSDYTDHDYLQSSGSAEYTEDDPVKLLPMSADDPKASEENLHTITSRAAILERRKEKEWLYSVVGQRRHQSKRRRLGKLINQRMSSHKEHFQRKRGSNREASRERGGELENRYSR